MSKELDATIKTINTTINIEKTFIDQLLKMLEIVLKDRDNLPAEELKKYENMQMCCENIKDHLINGGTLVPFRCSVSDMELIQQKLAANEEAFINATEGKDDKVYIGEFEGNHFAFDNIFMKESEDTYVMYIKNTDLQKANDLIAYLDGKYPNNIKLVEKDIKNILKIDENEKLMCLEVINDKTFKTIANVLNAYKVPFEIANQEYGAKIIYEKKDKEKVVAAIDTCKNIDMNERYLLIGKYNYEFNDRKEAQKQVDEMVNDAPKMDEILKDKDDKESSGRE